LKATLLDVPLAQLVGCVPRPNSSQLRDLVGPDVMLMVDANGGYSVGQARRIARTIGASSLLELGDGEKHGGSFESFE
jgi:hypothetical protein